jgi:hypothetical protein
MVLYDDKAELDLEKFDIYNYYRDQVCYLKLDKNLLNLNVDPDNWLEIKAIISKTDDTTRITELRDWFEKAAAGSYGPGKDFEFTDDLLLKICEEMKKKFERD